MRHELNLKQAQVCTDNKSNTRLVGFHILIHPLALETGPIENVQQRLATDSH